MQAVNMCKPSPRCPVWWKPSSKVRSVKSSLPVMVAPPPSWFAIDTCAGRRIGVAKGEFEVPDNIDTNNEEDDPSVHGR